MDGGVDLPIVIFPCLTYGVFVFLQNHQWVISQGESLVSVLSLFVNVIKKDQYLNLFKPKTTSQIFYSSWFRMTSNFPDISHKLFIQLQSLKFYSSHYYHRELKF